MILALSKRNKMCGEKKVIFSWSKGAKKELFHE